MFHAAALKHVPLLERDWDEGVKTNVFGSVNVADAAAAAGAAAMVMISTDKAIEPVSMLGATKRFAEMYCQALDADLAHRIDGGRRPMRLIAVRFGNVLASNGSVVPKFKAQIEAGGPGHRHPSGHGALLHDHPRGLRSRGHGGEPCARAAAVGRRRSTSSTWASRCKIVDLAERMIRLSGLEPGRDIEITFTGIRPGERLHEILFARDEPTTEIGIAGIVAARPVHPSLDAMRGWLAALEQGLTREERAAIYGVLHDAVPDYQGAAA